MNRQNFFSYLGLLLFCLILLPFLTQAQKIDYKPKILLVTAHPDDEVIYAATVFKTTQILNGVADLAIMTNGEGGYRYSTLGNYIYDKQLDMEEVGRAFLPGIRKKEAMAAGKIVGIRNYYFFDQKDRQYTKDIERPLGFWDSAWIAGRLHKIIKEENYDFVFTMLPRPNTHGHHKASALLALRAIQSLEPERRPIVLGTTIYREKGDTTNFDMLKGYPLTKINQNRAPLTFDRTRSFGYNDRLNYNIIANWMIAEHKSQGTVQLFINVAKVEVYLFYQLNDDSKYSKAKTFFDAVNAADIYKRGNK